MLLRPYQQDSVDKLRQSFASGKKSPLLFLPTGGGKTHIFTFVAKNAISKGGRVLIIVHRNELLMQACEKLRSIGLDYGVISANASMNLDRPVQVASVQTIVRRFDRMTGWTPTMIIVDEAHHVQDDNGWGKVLAQWTMAKVLGVTATPIRSDGGGLDGVFDDLVLGPSVRELTSMGFLSPTEIYAPPCVVDLSTVRRRMGDYANNDLEKAMDKPTIHGDAVKHYARICHGVPAIAFCVSVDHANHVAKAFQDGGFRSSSIDGMMDMATRKEAIAALGQGRIDVLTSCDVVSEGTDIPVVGAAILLRPTMSEGLYLQQVGRVLRPATGKTKAVVLDHVGNVGRHGMPDADREWTLAGTGKEGGGSKREGPPPPVTCDGCFRQVVRPLPPCCPYCGATFEKQNRLDKMKIEAAELERITAEQAETMRVQHKREQAGAKTMAELVEVGRRRGMKNPHGWAAHVFNNSWRSWAK
jgi:superfamily II DNA or RNA helicase